MNTKRIGNIGEAKALSKFVELGIPVYLPFGDNERVDLIADFHGKLQRIQVKTSSRDKNGAIIFDLVSSTTHRTKGTKHSYTSDEIDYFALYSTCRDKVYLLKIDEPRAGITIRYEESKNKQKNGINFESDFLIENILCVETLHGTPKEEQI